jgi:hypothetical protein
MQTKIRFDIKFHTNLQIIFLIYHFLLVHAGNVWMTMAITHQSIFLNKHLFVLHLDFPLALQPHFVKPWPSHIEASLTACLREISVSS